MAKKDFTKRQSAIDPVRAAVTNAPDTKSTRSAKDTKNTSDISDIKNVSDIKDDFRFSARFTSDQWKYMQELKWTTRRSITAILQDLVEEDMKKHPEIIKRIDELNG